MFVFLYTAVRWAKIPDVLDRGIGVGGAANKKIWL